MSIRTVARAKVSPDVVGRELLAPVALIDMVSSFYRGHVFQN